MLDFFHVVGGGLWTAIDLFELRKPHPNGEISVAYLVIAGILEYVFIYDGTRGPVLVLLSSTLALFAINLPILFGFAVAKFQDA